MHLIVYTSDYVGDEHEIDQVLDDISQQSQIRNAEKHITGVLFYHNGKFIQFIEGDESNLRDIMSLIKTSRRHTNLSYLVDEGVKQRGFSEWNMGCFNLSNKKTLNQDELERILAAYKKMLEINSQTLVTAYRTLLQHGVFEEKHA